MISDWPIVVAGPGGRPIVTIEGDRWVSSALPRKFYGVSALRAIPSLIPTEGVPSFFEHGHEWRDEAIGRVVSVQWDEPSLSVVGFLRVGGIVQEQLERLWLSNTLPGISMDMKSRWRDMPDGLRLVDEIMSVSSIDLVAVPLLGGGFLPLPLDDEVALIEHFIMEGNAAQRAAAWVKLSELKRRITSEHSQTIQTMAKG